jgi:tRNA uridine 5-carbamoylmethylation protein Kti12
MPFVHDAISNEIRLISLEKQTKKYSHPHDSYLRQKFSFIGNFAPASNQCDVVVAEIYTTMHKPNEIRRFYSPILIINPHNNPSDHEVTLFMLQDEKEVNTMKQWNPELSEKITQKTINDTHAYILLTEERYPPNYDLRCH